MAVAPLFNVDMATLRSKLRLTGAASADALALIDEAVLQVRQEIYRSLGAALIASLVATSLVDTPATDAEYRRVVAAGLEVKWVRLKCWDTMPVLFMDASGASLEAWNQESAFRQGRISQADRQRLDDEVQRDLAFLLGGTAGSELSIRADLIEPDETPQNPGDSLWGPWSRNVAPVTEE